MTLLRAESKRLPKSSTYPPELMTRKQNLLYSAHASHSLNSPIVFVHATHLTSSHLTRPSTASNYPLSLNYLVVKWPVTPKFKHFCRFRMAGWVCGRPSSTVPLPLSLPTSTPATLLTQFFHVTLRPLKPSFQLLRAYSGNATYTSEELTEF